MEEASNQRQKKLIEVENSSNNSINDYLLDYKKQKNSCLQKFIKFICCSNKNYDSKRKININGINKTNFMNIVENRRYNFFTFIPFVIIEQLYHFSNQFYVALMVTQFFDLLKVGFFADYFLPVLIVFTITFIKEAFDEYHRYIKDIEANNQSLRKLTSNGFKEIKSREVQIGDFLEIRKNERIPADMIVFSSKEESGTLFIRTDQLDGETDWKLRKAPISTQNLKYEDLFELKGLITLDAPSTFIYEFNGLLEIAKKCMEPENSEFEINDRIVKDSLSLENTIWANTILASESCIGIVIYTGKETRAQMNSSKPKAKYGILDKEINVYNRILFIIMIILALVIIALRGFTSNFMLNIFSLIRFVVLLSAILPISVRVNLEISKAINSFMINRNNITPETIVRNSNIPEELGRIEYIFTDKTGTLTKNEMKFKKISFENFYLNTENFEEYKKFLHSEYLGKNNYEELSTSFELNNKISRNSLNKNYKNSSISDFESKECSFIDTTRCINYRSMSSSNIEINEVLRKRKITIKKANIKILRESIQALALCNNVTTVNQSIEIEPKILEHENILENFNKTLKSKIEYQASSPDELALVNICKQMDVSLIFRDEKIIKILNPVNEIEEYEILACFPFTSESKRMGILLRNLITSVITFYLKGSESVISKFISPEYENMIKEKTENLASEGLRTLVITQKIIQPEFYRKWLLEYSEASISMYNRKDKFTRVISQLENNMEFLCISGVEDKLQDNVQETITSLTNAGIKFWMLTGDKLETAACVAISAGIKLKSNPLFYIKDNPCENYVEKELNNYSQMKNTILIIDGVCLDIAINKFEKLFFNSTLTAPSVVCCRCSPTQKAQILANVKKYTIKRTLAIGDGGNDVSMIQEAHCGVGIVGKEGKQASLAADFSITEFHHLRYLLLWFGRLSYKNTASICLFVFHRGMIIAFMQYIFCLLFYYSPVPLYNGFLVMGYTSIYTNFPVFSLLLDRDTKIDNVLKFPPLYKQILKGRELNFKTFLYWLVISLFQASIIMFGTIIVFKDQLYLNIISLTFTNLIFAELLNIYTQIKHFHWLMIVSLTGTLITYFLTMIFLTSIIDIKFIFHIWTLLKIFGIALVGWLPIFIHVKIKEKIYPEAHEKLNNLKKSMPNKIILSEKL